MPEVLTVNSKSVYFWDCLSDSVHDTMLGGIDNDSIDENCADAMTTPRGNIMTKLVKSSVGASKSTDTVESVADILQCETHTLIAGWLTRVENEPELSHVPLNHEERTGHLPHLIHDLIQRLRLDAGTKAPISRAAAQHGDLRCKQGYTAAMMIEESRLLQVSIFTMLNENIKRLEISALLPDVVTIADEVDAQLKEQMLRFMAADKAEKTKSK